MINQNDNQDDNQDDNQIEKNVSCNVFFEQLELLNQLPENERGNVIYLALLKAFSRVNNQVDNQDDSQVENQLENTYISISKSISLSKLSITVLNLLNKTLDCKIYSKNWGGKRQGSGKPTSKNQHSKKGQVGQVGQNEQTKTETENKTTLVPTKQQIVEYATHQLGKKINVNEFCNWYDAQGWVDKNGFPINWKQKVQSWIRNNKSPDIPEDNDSSWIKELEKKYGEG